MKSMSGRDRFRRLPFGRSNKGSGLCIICISYLVLVTQDLPCPELSSIIYWLLFYQVSVGLEGKQRLFSILFCNGNQERKPNANQYLSLSHNPLPYLEFPYRHIWHSDWRLARHLSRRRWVRDHGIPET